MRSPPFSPFVFFRSHESVDALSFELSSDTEVFKLACEGFIVEADLINDSPRRPMMAPGDEVVDFGLPPFGNRFNGSVGAVRHPTR